MGRLVVHVGPPKTATTSIQHALFTNTELLARHGVHLPASGRLEFEPQAVCHHHLAWQIMGSPRFRRDRGGWEELAVELASVDAETVLLSSEVFATAATTSRGTEELNDRLLELDRDVTVVYIVRDPLSRLNSYYAQQVKLMRAVPGFAGFVGGALRRHEFDLTERTRAWSRHSRIAFVAIPFSDLVAQDPLTTLLRAARIDVPLDELVDPQPPLNITLGPVAVEAIRLLRHYLGGLNPGLSYDDLAVRKLHRVAAHRARELGWCETPFWGWTPPLAQKATRRLAASNEAFAQQVWGTAWPMPLPLDRPLATARLLALPEAELDAVHQFVVDMSRRYARLRRGSSRE